MSRLIEVLRKIGLFVKGAMSSVAHARANENKLETVGPTFLSSVGDFEGCFHLFKSQPSFDSWQSFILRIILW